MSVVGPSADLLFLLALLAGLALGAAEGGIAAGLLRAAGIGRAWLAGPAVAALALVPVLLARDLMEVVGPREVWVGQSLTLQVLFPLLIGLTAVIAVLSAPRRGSGSPRGGAQ